MRLGGGERERTHRESQGQKGAEEGVEIRNKSISKKRGIRP